MPRVYHQMTPEEMRASEARFTKLMNDTRAAAEADPTHPSRPYFGLPMMPREPEPPAPEGRAAEFQDPS